MLERIARLKSPEDCAVFEKNVTKLGRPDLAVAARKRALELRAQKYGSNTELERECLEAVYAYESVLSAKNGKTTRATHTWQMVKRHGIIKAIERAVNSESEITNYKSLLEMGLEDYAFEVMVARHPDQFSSDAVQHSQDRIVEWKKCA
ncbi:MAG: hypothetical protein P4L87_07425 [Formivibrio sp.]|nr:hypothetical protein [Formivibrio sp.]